MSIIAKFHRFTKFSLVGAIITATSLTTSFIFLKIIGTPLIITYIVNYFSMITFSYLLNAYFVFKRKFDFKQLIFYYLAYISGMILGIFLLKLFRTMFSVENWVLSYMVIPFTMMSNFLFADKIFKRRPDEE